MADGLAMAAPQTPQVDLEASCAISIAAVLIDLEKIGTTRYRGAVIPSPWPDGEEDTTAA